MSITTVAGDLTLANQVSTAGGDITLSPAGNVNLAYNGTVVTQTTANLTITRPVLLQANATITQTVGNSADTLLFNGTIDSPGTAYSLTVTGAGDNVTFIGAIGSTDPLSALTVTSAAALTIPNVGNSVGPSAGVGILSIAAGAAGSIAFSGTYYQTSGNQSWAAGILGSSRTLTTSAATTFLTPATLAIHGDFTSTAGNATLISNDIDMGNFGTWNLGASTPLFLYPGTDYGDEYRLSAIGWNLDSDGTGTA